MAVAERVAIMSESPRVRDRDTPNAQFTPEHGKTNVSETTKLQEDAAATTAAIKYKHGSGSH